MVLGALPHGPVEIHVALSPLSQPFARGAGGPGRIIGPWNGNRKEENGRQKVQRREFRMAAGAAWPGLAAGLQGPPGRQEAALFKLGIITDEISQDVEQALDFISSYELGFCELRGLWGKNIMNAPEERLERAKALIAKLRLRVSDIGSPVFKYNLPEMPARPEKRDTFRADFTDQDSDSLLQKSFELARFFGTAKVRIFSFWRVDHPEKAYALVRHRLAKAAALAA